MLQSNFQHSFNMVLVSFNVLSVVFPSPCPLGRDIYFGRTRYKTTLQKDKEVLGREENWQFIFSKQVCEQRERFDSWRTWRRLLFSIILFLTSLTKDISADVCCVGPLGVQKVWEMAVSCLFYILFFTNMLDPRLREKQHFLHDAVGAPGGSGKHGMRSAPEHFSH